MSMFRQPRHSNASENVSACRDAVDSSAPADMPIRASERARTGGVGFAEVGVPVCSLGLSPLRYGPSFTSLAVSVIESARFNREPMVHAPAKYAKKAKEGSSGERAG